MHRRAILAALALAFPASATACVSDGLSWPSLPLDVAGSVLLLEGPSGPLGTAFVVRNSSAMTAAGLNVAMTAAHAVVSSREWWAVPATGGRVPLRPLRVDAAADVAVLEPFPSRESEWRSIRGLFLGTQMSGSALFASPGGPVRGASGAPVLDETLAVRGVLTEVGPSPGQGAVWFEEGLEMGTGLPARRELPSASMARFRPVPPPLASLIGPESKAPHEGEAGLLTLLSMNEGACVPHQGLRVRRARRPQ